MRRDPRAAAADAHGRQPYTHALRAPRRSLLMSVVLAL